MGKIAPTDVQMFVSLLELKGVEDPEGIVKDVIEPMAKKKNWPLLKTANYYVNEYAAESETATQLKEALKTIRPEDLKDDTKKKNVGKKKKKRK